MNRYYVQSSGKSVRCNHRNPLPYPVRLMTLHASMWYGPLYSNVARRCSLDAADPGCEDGPGREMYAAQIISSSRGNPKSIPAETDAAAVDDDSCAFIVNCINRCRTGASIGINRKT